MARLALALVLSYLFAVRSLMAASDTVEPQIHEAIALMNNLFQRAVPAATVMAVLYQDNSIVLSGSVERLEDVEIIVQIARNVGRNVCGKDIEIDNQVWVGPPQHVLMDMALFHVDRAALEAADLKLQRKYVKFFGKLRATNGTEHRQCLAFLHKLQDAKQAKLVAEAKLLTFNGRTAAYSSGGACWVPNISGLPVSDVNLEHNLEPGSRIVFLPIVIHNGSVHLDIEANVGSHDSEEKAANDQQHTNLALEAGQTVILTMPDNRRSHPDRPDDLVLLATIEVVTEGD